MMENESLKYWVACSGGVDSVFLAYILKQLNLGFGILHCNFHLRGEESNKDEIFVRKLAQDFGVPIRVKEFDTESYKLERKINTQLAARELRYSWFDEIIQKEGKIVVLAHHRDDQMETFFLQLRRGGKVKGLAGMPVFKEGYFRPLLDYSKQEILSICEGNNWHWREDLSNLSNDYTRNWYRNEVLPYLEEIQFPTEEIIPLIQDFQKVLRAFQKTVIPSQFSVSDWRNIPIWWQEFILDFHQLGEYSTSEVCRLSKSEKGKFLENDFATLWNEGDFLSFVKKEVSKSVNFIVKEISKKEWKINTLDIFFDQKKVNGKISVRKWQNGDYFQPLGMKGIKSVAKFLRDRKVPSSEKENQYVLVGEKGNIIGIFGFGVGEQYKVDSETEIVTWMRLVD